MVPLLTVMGPSWDNWNLQCQCHLYRLYAMKFFKKIAVLARLFFLFKCAWLFTHFECVSYRMMKETIQNNLFLKSGAIDYDTQVILRKPSAKKINSKYSKPPLMRIRFDRRFYPVYTKIRFNRRWLFLAWRHLSAEISVEITKMEHIFDSQQTFAEAKRIYWCIYNGIWLVTAISISLRTIFRS